MLAPRIHLAPGQLATSTWDEMSRVLRRVSARVFCGTARD